MKKTSKLKNPKSISDQCNSDEVNVCGSETEFEKNFIEKVWAHPPYWKRAFDIILSLTAIVMLSPIWLGATLAIFASRTGPVFFVQTRVGLGERTFKMIKFRTHFPSQSRHGSLATTDRDLIALELAGKAEPEPETQLFRQRQQSVTKVGAVLRHFSIDELPQLVNVLRGEMSLVGPRPALPWEVAMFNSEQRRRHTVLPGMTGLWQVRGRNRLSTAKMLELDLEYIGYLSLWNDLKILFSTPRAAIWDCHTA